MNLSSADFVYLATCCPSTLIPFSFSFVLSFVPCCLFPLSLYPFKILFFSFLLHPILNSSRVSSLCYSPLSPSQNVPPFTCLIIISSSSITICSLSNDLPKEDLVARLNHLHFLMFSWSKKQTQSLSTMSTWWIRKCVLYDGLGNSLCH